MINFQSLPISTKAKYLLTDSRTVAFPTESIFFAIKGLRNDGHQFLKELYLKGVREFVIEEKAYTKPLIQLLETLKNCKIWLVPDAIISLQNFVSAKRSQFNLPVIAITGSNGKTIVKEWLSQLLAQKFNIVKSPKSYNSQLGVPLSVWQMNSSHNLGIFEAGISMKNEMGNLESVVQPSIGIFTNIGTAHDEFFQNKTEKIQEKLKLFKHVKCLIYCADDSVVKNEIGNYIKENNPNCDLLAWSMIDENKIFFHKNTFSNTTKLTYKLIDELEEIAIEFNDEASIQNLCHCIVALKYLGLNWAEIKARLQHLRPVSMRLELKEGINNCYLIDDTYNNDFIGLKLALEFLKQQNQHEKKILILSDILQINENDKNLYSEIAQLLTINKVSLLIGVGACISKNKDLFPANSIFFRNTELLIESISKLNFKDSIILIKGARTFQFEKIVNLLQSKSHETVLEINLDAITHNLNYYKQKIGNETRIMAMVKAFAYGAGNLEVASHLQFQGVDYLGVAYTDEGVYLRENGIVLPIMVMNPNESDFQKLIDYTLEPEIYSLKKLKQFSEFIDNQVGLVKIHIKLDTGMHRLGFEYEDIESVLAILNNNPNIIVATIFSHLAASENVVLDEFTVKQVEDFAKMAATISEGIGYLPIRHMLNTAGIARFTNYRMDMVRLGVGLYGIGTTEEDKQNLMMVSTLKTKISQVKNIANGDTVGYGRKGVTNRNSKIATIAIGYADGFDRRLGNGVGKVAINGQLCPTIGNICMDMCMVDITDIEAVEGDEVVVFGQNPTVYDLAEYSGTIAYEILTNIGERVKRVFYKV